MRYDADEPSILTIIHNQRLISTTFLSFEINKRRFTDLTMPNWYSTSRLILALWSFDLPASIMTLTDWCFAYCNWRLILCLPVPVGLFSSQMTPSIIKSADLPFALGRNSTNVLKCNAKISAASRSCCRGFGFMPAGVMTLAVCCFFFIIFSYSITLAKLRYIWCIYTRYSVFVCIFGYCSACFCRMTYRTKARSASAMPTRAVPPFATCGKANHQKHPLQLKKKFGGGKSQKIRQRVFLVRRSTACRARRHGSDIPLEMGSSLVVKMRQNKSLTLMGGLFILMPPAVLSRR